MTMSPFLPSVLTPLENLLGDLLAKIADVIPGHSWAWSVVVLTAIVRIIILPITAKQTTSMLRMQHLQPHIKKLQERYKDDKQEMQSRLMEFYRDNKVNPLASCFPLLLQFPVFIALFYTLKSYPFPKNANLSFLGSFVPDIRVHINQAHTAGIILIVVYVASQMVSSWVMSANSPNQQQRKLFLIMPVFFTIFILRFPIAVMLYWITTNIWTLGQYKAIMAMSSGAGAEIIMPEDTKGNKKIIEAKPVPGKGGKGSAANTKAGDPGDDATTATQQARPNKRRR